MARPGHSPAPCSRPEARVPIPGPLCEARFLGRLNRFVLLARLANGSEARAHLPDPGRLRELLLPGRPVWLRPAARPERRTRWTAVLVAAPEGGFVSLDTGLPNRLVARALRAGLMEEFEGFRLERTEAPRGRSRVDFRLAGPDGRVHWLEVKSVTLAADGTGLFPDAVTARGARHVEELAAAVRAGAGASVLFVAQRDSVHRVRTAGWIDPRFAAVLHEARLAGVGILARGCRVSLTGVALGPPLPVALSADDRKTGGGA